mgnify:CR=1 FL=1
MQIAPGLMCVKGKKAQVALSYHLSSLPSVNSGKRYVELSTQHAWPDIYDENLCFSEQIEFGRARARGEDGSTLPLYAPRHLFAFFLFILFLFFSPLPFTLPVPSA